MEWLSVLNITHTHIHVNILSTMYVLYIFTKIQTCIKYIVLYIIIMIYIYTGRWFGTCFIFPYLGNNNPNWLIFFRGLKPPTRYILISPLFWIDPWKKDTLKLPVNLRHRTWPQKERSCDPWWIWPVWNQSPKTPIWFVNDSYHKYMIGM